MPHRIFTWSRSSNRYENQARSSRWPSVSRARPAICARDMRAARLRGLTGGPTHTAAAPRGSQGVRTVGSVQRAVIGCASGFEPRTLVALKAAVRMDKFLSALEDVQAPLRLAGFALFALLFARGLTAAKGPP